MSPVLRRVLVGFDGAEPSRDALALALRLADPEGAELLLADVDEHRAFRVPVRHRPAPERLAEGLAALPADVVSRGLTRSAKSAAQGLRELAEEEHADVIVLGAHGGHGPQATPGPTAMRLLHAAPCAVAVAPPSPRERDHFHHLGVAYDGSAEARGALTLAYALAERDGAAVSVYRAIPRVGVAYSGSVSREADAAVLQVRLDAQAELDAAADAAPPGVNPETVLVHDEPDGIARACDGIVDLLIMGSRGNGPLQRAFSGSASEAIMLRATQPVLVVPRARAAAGT